MLGQSVVCPNCKTPLIGSIDNHQIVCKSCQKTWTLNDTDTAIHNVVLKVQSCHQSNNSRNIGGSNG